uniref:PMD domain-containing protein n=1 Tax=Panagrellus redivivus TaxID=6233 RepID=A0A7E4W5X9_PANRE
MVFPNAAFEQLWTNLCLELSTYFYVPYTVPDFAKNWAAHIALCLNVGSLQYPVYDHTRSDIIYIKLAQFLENHMKTMFEQIHFLNGDLVVSQYVAYWSAFERRIPEIVVIFDGLQEWITIKRDAGIN